jgi:hypothetical protein
MSWYCVNSFTKFYSFYNPLFFGYQTLQELCFVKTISIDDLFAIPLYTIWSTPGYNIFDAQRISIKYFNYKASNNSKRKLWSHLKTKICWSYNVIYGNCSANSYPFNKNNRWACTTWGNSECKLTTANKYLSEPVIQPVFIIVCTVYTNHFRIDSL